MSKNLQCTMIAAAAQYGALGLGCLMGFARFVGNEYIGGVALLALVGEILHFRLSPRLGQAHPNTALLCEALFLYAGWFYNGLFIFDPPSLDYSDGAGFVITVHLLLPFLLAIGPLVRSKAWIGVAGVIVFFATVLSMLIFNGFCLTSGTGFFTHWIA